jgi:hypothetical protein
VSTEIDSIGVSIGGFRPRRGERDLNKKVAPKHANRPELLPLRQSWRNDQYDRIPVHRDVAGTRRDSFRPESAALSLSERLLGLERSSTSTSTVRNLRFSGALQPMPVPNRAGSIENA